MALIHLLLFKGSRKVGYGLWLFITANAYLWLKIIQSSDWMNCVILGAALVGGGTLGDAYFKAKLPKEVLKKPEA